ncbi:MAG TPA: hypothetical protein DCQ98_05955 [Planctomycetaceae bacterium]|nr:hypothetical protein [Planctomycetaceae bacterium]
MGILGLIGVLVLGLLAYLAPSVTAAKRDHPRWASIVLLNLLLGWTVLGWIIAMAWAIRPRSSGSETSRSPGDDDRVAATRYGASIEIAVACQCFDGGLDPEPEPPVGSFWQMVSHPDESTDLPISLSLLRINDRQTLDEVCGTPYRAIGRHCNALRRERRSARLRRRIRQDMAERPRAETSSGSTPLKPC